MILQALVDYYEILSQKGKIAKQGWSKENVSDRIILDEEGHLTGIISVRNMVRRGKRDVPVDAKMMVPEHAVKTSGVKASFLCDKYTYIFGIIDEDKIKNDVYKQYKNRDDEIVNEKIQKKIEKETEKAKESFIASQSLHLSLLEKCKNPIAKAIKKFYVSWDPDKAWDNPVFLKNREEILSSSNMIFQVDGYDAQDNDEIKRQWDNRENVGNNVGQCLVTGENNVAIAKTHPKIKGVVGSPSMGGSLVSFNTSSLESFGHAGDQGLNAPVSEYAAFAYTTALNELLRKGSSLLCGDTTVVFWAQSGEDTYSQFYSALMGGNDTNKLSDEDIKSVLEKISKGNPADLNGVELSPDEPFYVLGLAPNAARLSVRFFWRNTFGIALKNINAHQERMKICRPSWEPETLSLYRLLNASVNPNSKKSNASPLLAGSLLRSILQDSPYPEAMYRQFLLRIKADSDKIDDKGNKINLKITYPRAAFIKAYLIKNHEKEWGGEITMKVNENCNAIPYVLGRLFAVLEGLQQAANPGINATIKDRYFNAACATPGTVFPVLLKLSNAHLNKLGKDKKALAITIQKKIGDLLGKVSMPDQGSPIPGRLTLDEQGMFILGYYQETQDRFTKKEDKE